MDSEKDEPKPEGRLTPEAAAKIEDYVREKYSAPKPLTEEELGRIESYARESLDKPDQDSVVDEGDVLRLVAEVRRLRQLALDANQLVAFIETVGRGTIVGASVTVAADGVRGVMDRLKAEVDR